jgi:hypothetical protein
MRSTWRSAAAAADASALLYGLLARGWPALVFLVAFLAGHTCVGLAGARAQDAAPRELGSTSTACTAERFVTLRTSPSLDAALMAEVRTDLATELEPRGIAVCDPGSGERAPEVVVHVRPVDDVLVIELDDRVTHKRVARDLSLRAIPANGQALAVAIAIDELLRASWAELALQRASSGEADAASGERVPRFTDTRTVNARGARSARHRRFDLGAALGYAHTRDDFDAFTLSLRAALWPWQSGWAELRVIAIESLAASSRYGDVVARGVGGSLTLGGCSARERRLFGCGGLRSELDLLLFRGVRPELADARKQASAVISVSAVGLFALELSSELYLFAELALGAVTTGARATDGERTLMGVTGLLVGTQLGLGVAL